MRHDVSSLLPRWAIYLDGKSNFILRRGWTTALGYATLANYDSVLLLLCQSLEHEADVEAKRNSAKSIGRIFERVTNVEGILSFRCFLMRCVGQSILDCLDKLS